MSNDSVHQLSGFSSPSWLDQGWMVSDYFSRLYWPQMKQLRWRECLSTWSLLLQKATPSLSNGDSQDLLWQERAFFKSLLVLCYECCLGQSKSLGHTYIQGDETDLAS